MSGVGVAHCLLHTPGASRAAVHTRARRQGAVARCLSYYWRPQQGYSQGEGRGVCAAMWGRHGEGLQRGPRAAGRGPCGGRRRRARVGRSGGSGGRGGALVRASRNTIPGAAADPRRSQACSAALGRRQRLIHLELQPIPAKCGEGRHAGAFALVGVSPPAAARAPRLALLHAGRCAALITCPDCGACPAPGPSPVHACARARAAHVSSGEPMLVFVAPYATLA